MAETLRTNSAESVPRTFSDAACPRELSVYGLLVREAITASRELFGRLGAAGPVHWDRYAGAWLIVGPDEVKQVLGDDRFAARRLSDQQAPGDTDQIAMTEVAARMLVQRDGAEHLKLKRVVQRVLSPGRIAALKPFLRDLADELLPDDAPVTIDFAATVARTFPLFVLARLLGIPRADLPMVLTGSDAMTRIIGGLHYTVDPDVHAKARTLFDYALDLVRERRARPGDDGASAFVAAADAAGGYDDIDIAANLMMLIASGHQTMPGFLGIAVHDALRAGAGLGEVDRALAAVTPSRFVGRVATEAVVVGGCRIEAGAAVLVLLAAANWALLDRESGPLRHVAFGYGRHRCAGAALAELEGAVLFDKVRELWPRLRISTDVRPSWNNNANLPALTSLPIEIGASWTIG